MKIISIDPGYERLGIAIIDLEKKELDSFIFSECFKTNSKEEHSTRLAKIQKRILEIIKIYKPTELAIETLFFNTNAKTALMVAEARGTIIATAKNEGLEIFEYSPQQIKIAVSGNGKSDKNSIIKIIPMLINIKKNISNDDEFDAIACGLTHRASRKNKNLKK
ncbi:MAG TPA: crossover junction endodeoxyribonuclease RuvC [Candidatus Paceibacterota bacterium]|nr:crossover junction endodeoxyribonuclease RuvC [Candidatus Paceibacterota bacterium]HMP18982.1 crossover junction endodeoxyribonuclease RuvC [Candidatus Paceibacterota bacterium]HMP85243.1 crossover junction endodeoxyribonuclease RuvC [Candidatus Paceibacterota bacterium]